MMDDRSKSEIRREFTARFWRLMVIVPVMVGLLLWWWLSADKHGGFLFLTVLPLMFLVPLARYYYAIRSLTEPESPDSAARIETALAVSGVDEGLKARIRRRVRLIHWWVQAFLIVLIVLGIFAKWGFREVADSYSNMKLSDASSAVVKEFSRFYFGRGAELLPFPPPERAEDRPAWAARIEAHLGQPAAVFIKEGPSLFWVTRPDSLADGIAVVPQLFDDSLSRDERGSIDTVGSYEVRRISNLLPEGGSKVWIVGPLNRDLRWGIVLGFWDTWRVFFASLKDAERMSLPMESPAWTIQEAVALTEKDLYDKPAMRAFLNGEVVYASPGLDTSRHLYKVDSPPLRWEYYESEMNEHYALFIGKGPVSWRNLVAWAVLMAAFFTLYRWIRKLTAPVS